MTTKCDQCPSKAALHLSGAGKVLHLCSSCWKRAVQRNLSRQ